MNDIHNQRIRFEVFASPGFILALMILLLNDYYLKEAFPNWLTGKLSDFAGLFLFSLFWLAFFQRRYFGITVLTAVFFILWKLPLSQPVIDLWNNNSVIKIARVVDYSDLPAIGVLPLSVKYSFSLSRMRCDERYAISIIFMTLFAILGTSVVPARYSLNFELQAQDHVTGQVGQERNEKANKTIKLIAETNGLTVVPYNNSTAEYVRYEGNQLYMETHFDIDNNILFVSIEAYSPEKNHEKADQIQKEIFSALEAEFKNITIQRETIRYHKEDTKTTLRINTPSVKFPLPSWCASNGKNNSEITRAFELFEKYMLTYPHDDASSSVCNSPDFCERAFCRCYELGKVIGAGRFERAVTVKSSWSAGWSGASLDIEFIEHAEDEAMNIQKMVQELREAFQKSLNKETTIEVKGN